MPVPPRLALAAAVARTDPAQAAELAGTPEPSGGSREAYSLNALVEAAYRCGAAPEQGLKVVDAIQGQGARSYKIEALGWLAVAVARHGRDPKRAHALIDQALALAVDGKDEGFPWRSSGGADAAAARVALCARRVGYPDMDSVLGRVLATRAMGDGVNGNVGGWSRTLGLLAAPRPRPGAAAPPDRGGRRVDAHGQIVGRADQPAEERDEGPRARREGWSPGCSPAGRRERAVEDAPSRRSGGPRGRPAGVQACRNWRALANFARPPRGHTLGRGVRVVSRPRAGHG
ncbi:MAG: hypothetical protein U0790_10735 [Isosphaeraceae bacterium]